jgi:LDH2 family malate/lactate/ureidoglycolate dehydrogenase
MPRLSAEYLHQVSREIFTGLGTPEDIAARVTEVLVGANLAGHDSHGILRIPSYLEEVDQKKVVVDARPVVVRQTDTTAVMASKGGWGHYASDRAMSIAIEKAKNHGMGAVVLGRCNHTGRMGEYAEMAARAGCVGMVFLGYGGTGLGWCAPFHGTDKMFMTNPVSIGVPVAGSHPFLLDYATTLVSRGKVKVAHSKGEPCGEGWILDSNGMPTTSAEDFMNDGFLQFFGLHKGYAMALATVLLGGLSGAFDDANVRMGGVLFLAMDIEAFCDPDTYSANVAKLLERIRSSRRVREDEPVLVPGDPEVIAREQRNRDGIDVPDSVWNAILEGARAHGIALPPEPAASAAV